jgi:hypothetical protein
MTSHRFRSFSYTSLEAEVTLDISVREHTPFATSYTPDLRACIEAVIGQDGIVKARW